MSLHYASIRYTAADTTLKVPVGGNHALRLPRDEQNDPWEMHPRQLPDGTTVGAWPDDPNTALLIPAVTGLAVITVDVAWEGAWNDGTIRRAYIVGDTLPYEETFATIGPDMTWTVQAFVTAGEPVVVMLGHTAETPQALAAARVGIVINDDIAEPPVRRIRVRAGTDPDPVKTEGPPNVGDGIAQPPYDPEPNIP